MTQEDRLINYLYEHKTITALEAIEDLGILRLASRVSDLRRRGYQITSKMIKVKNRFGETCRIAEYSI